MKSVVCDFKTQPHAFVEHIRLRALSANRICNISPNASTFVVGTWTINWTHTIAWSTLFALLFRIACYVLEHATIIEFFILVTQDSFWLSDASAIFESVPRIAGSAVSVIWVVILAQIGHISAFPCTVEVVPVWAYFALPIHKLLAVGIQFLRDALSTTSVLISSFAAQALGSGWKVLAKYIEAEAFSIDWSLLASLTSIFSRIVQLAEEGKLIAYTDLVLVEPLLTFLTCVRTIGHRDFAVAYVDHSHALSIYV